jgi:hypothetical protein
MDVMQYSRTVMQHRDKKVLYFVRRVCLEEMKNYACDQIQARFR